MTDPPYDLNLTAPRRRVNGLPLGVRNIPLVPKLWLGTFPIPLVPKLCLRTVNLRPSRYERDP